MKELYEERNRGEKVATGREKSKEKFFLKTVRQIFSHCLSFGFVKVEQNLLSYVITLLKDFVIFSIFQRQLVHHALLPAF